MKELIIAVGLMVAGQYAGFTLINQLRKIRKRK